MAYIPKNKIQINLYTPGGEFTKKLVVNFMLDSIINYMMEHILLGRV